LGEGGGEFVVQRSLAAEAHLRDHEVWLAFALGEQEQHLCVHAGYRTRVRNRRTAPEPHRSVPFSRSLSVDLERA
jgi:hypothetical protein